MNDNNNRIKTIYSYFNTIRGNNTPGEYETTLAVLKKTMDQEYSANREFDDSELYELMRNVADEFGVPNPFTDESLRGTQIRN